MSRITAARRGRRARQEAFRAACTEWRTRTVRYNGAIKAGTGHSEQPISYAVERGDLSVLRRFDA
jgi:hypothetical protein